MPPHRLSQPGSFNHNDPKYSCMHAKNAVKFILALLVLIAGATVKMLFTVETDGNTDRKATLVGLLLTCGSLVCLVLAIFKKIAFLLLPEIGCMTIMVVSAVSLLFTGQIVFLTSIIFIVLCCWCTMALYKYFGYLSDLITFQQTPKERNPVLVADRY